MQLTIPRSAFLVLTLMATIFVYYSSLNGTPIWDDLHYLFKDNVITGDHPYWHIFAYFTWPASVSAEKFLYSIWKENYFYYHLLNLVLHLLNGYLLLRLLEKLNLAFPRWITLLFLLHPSNVISVSWMIQLKTVMCFTFAILSVHSFLRSQDDTRFWPLTWLCFLLSVLSKSASLPLSVIYLFLGVKRNPKRNLLWMIPIFLITFYSTYKILKSEITIEGSEQHQSKDFVARDGERPTEVKPRKEIKTEVKPAPARKPLPDRLEKLSQFQLLLKTNDYYFWQIPLPFESYPVKGQGLKAPGARDYFHLIFLGALLYLTWKTVAGLALIGGYLMLTPFLGLVIAPFMNLTWVSEQHLYLVLPFFLVMWVELLTKIKSKYVVLIPALFAIFFGIQTYRAAFYYQDDIIFYKKSLQADNTNLPLVHNLAVAYIRKNDLKSALGITGAALIDAQNDPQMKENKYFPYVEGLHGRLVKAVLQKP